MDINKSHAIVTGGSSGLGGATVDLIIKSGGKATILDVQEDKANEKVSLHGSSSCQFFNADVSDEKLVQNVIEDSIKHFGPIQLAVNCAGIGIAKKISGRKGVHDLSSYKRVIEVNLVGTFNVLKTCAEKMQNNNPDVDGGKGVIVNTASVAAYDGQIGQAAYSSSKGGIVGLTLPAARELATSGIRVCTIAPGLFETPMMAGLPEAAKQSLIESTLFPKRLGLPEEFAKLVLSIYENNMLNGETIRLDGSLRMAPN